MARPDIKTFHKSWREHWITPVTERPNFLGRNEYDIRWRLKNPPVNLKKKESLFEMEIAVPGFTKEDLEITVKNNLLIIRGERKTSEVPDSEYVIKEFDTDTFERVFELANEIGHEKITAVCQNGMLKLSFIDVPAEEEKAYKTVPVG